MPDSIITSTDSFAASTTNKLLLTGADMQALWTEYERARDGYHSSDPSSLKAYEAVQQRIFEAHTTDLAGIAIKLKAVNEFTNNSVVTDVIADIDDALKSSTAATPLKPLGFIHGVLEAARPFNPGYHDDFCEPDQYFGLVAALRPWCGDFSVADALNAVGMLRTVGIDIQADGLGTGRGDRDNKTDGDVLWGVANFLEKFIATARASGPDCVAARALFIKLFTEDDTWGGGAYDSIATDHMREDVRAMRTGEYEPETFGNQSGVIPWLYQVIKEDIGDRTADEAFNARNPSYPLHMQDEEAESEAELEPAE